MSNPKELDYFDKDRTKGYSDDLERYEHFFSNVRPEHIAIGEASTGYLRSRVAADEILKYAPAARFIIGLRNPVEMAISWHGQVLFEAWEDVPNFETAWSLQDSRRVGRNIPRLCPDVSNLMYADVCALGSQLARWLEKVPRERVFIYTLDEMKDTPQLLWSRILSFLGVLEDGRRDFPAYNEGKRIPRVLSIATRLVADTKRNLGLNVGFGILKWLNRKLSKKPAHKPSDAFVAELYAYFRPEVELLQTLTGRDLSVWVAPPNCGDTSSVGHGEKIEVMR